MFHKANVASLLRQISEREIQQVGRFREHVRTHHSLEVAALENLPEDVDPEYAELASADVQLLDDVLGLSDELAIVALYRVVELETKALFRFLAKKSASRELSSVANLRERLAKDFGIDLDKIPFYPSVNELRLLNNAIKHEKVAGSELVKYGWTEGGILVGLDGAFERIAPDVPRYLEALASQKA